MEKAIEKIDKEKTKETNKLELALEEMKNVINSLPKERQTDSVNILSAKVDRLIDLNSKQSEEISEIADSASLYDAVLEKLFEDDTEELIKRLLTK